MKKIIFILFCLFSSFYIFAEDFLVEESVKCYREALLYFDELDYGKALKKCEEAINVRKEKVSNELNEINISLSSKKAQTAGDNLNELLKILINRNENKTVSIINNYLKAKGEDFFDNSINNLKEYIQSQTEYPEAQKMLGDIYRLEGEYYFAEEYYLKALDNKDVLDIPNDKYEILYLLAEISEIQKDYDRMEIRLLNILSDDKFYNDKALYKSIENTLKNKNGKAFENFFNLYRSENYFSLKAYYKLGNYYFNNNQDEKALKLISMAVLTGFTKMVKIISQRNINYEYTDFASMLYQTQYYDDIIDWASENKIWESMDLLAKICLKFGYKDFAIKLLRALVEYNPLEYWQKSAVLQLSTIK